MRTCWNCRYFEGSSIINDKLSKICNENGKRVIQSKQTCDNHIYRNGYELEKNYIYYDESYIAPGFLVINVDRDGKMNKFFKFFNAGDNKNPVFGIRAYSNKVEKKDKESSLEFDFRVIEDDKSGLNDCFNSICRKLNNKEINTIDLNSNSSNTVKFINLLNGEKLVFSKEDTSTNFYDVLLGDEMTCEFFRDLSELYEDLTSYCDNKLSSDEVKRLILKGE